MTIVRAIQIEILGIATSIGGWESEDGGQKIEQKWAAFSD
jgi:hypothetical protein